MEILGSLLLVCEVEYLPPGSRVCIEQEEPEKVLSFDEFKLEDSLKVANFGFLFFLVFSITMLHNQSHKM